MDADIFIETSKNQAFHPSCLFVIYKGVISLLAYAGAVFIGALNTTQTELSCYGKFWLAWD